MSDRTRVYVVAEGARARVEEAASRLLEALGDRAQVLGVDLDGELDLSDVEADLVVVLGGDGSILAAARRLGANQIPLFGINFGKLGFLACARAREVGDRVASVVVDRAYTISSRMKFEATVNHADGRVEGPIYGVNDAVVERWDPRTVSVHLLVDGELTTTYRGDGLIVATPTGSTAHSLAAGGPIVEPGAAVFVVTPMCAHSFANRPIVLRPERVVEMVVGPGTRHPGLSVDGQVLVPLDHGDRVTVRRAEHGMKLVVPEDRSFFDVLRTRLRWAGQPPYETG